MSRRPPPDRAVKACTTDLQARYDRLVVLAMRMGSWLTGPQARLLSVEEWEAYFRSYQGRLEELRQLSDQLRPRMTEDAACKEAA